MRNYCIPICSLYECCPIFPLQWNRHSAQNNKILARNLRELARKVNFILYMFAAGSFALPRVELGRELRCEVQNYSSVKSSLLVGRSTMPCQQTLLLLAGGLNLGSCPYRILREILRKLAWDLGSCFLLGAYQQES